MTRRPASNLVTVERLQRALITAATLVDRYGEVYTPIFERIERELADRENQHSATWRARQLVRRLAVPVASNPAGIG